MSSNIMFHSGSLYVIRQGTSLAQPRKIMTVQETSFDFKGDVKELIGERQFAVDVAMGSIKISGKAKHGQLDPAAMNELFFGQTIATGSRILVQDESHTVASAAMTATGGSDYEVDMGVVNAATGQLYTRVASAPDAGEYTINTGTGVYALNASENGNVLLIDYIMSDTDGTTLTLDSEVAGTTVTFKGVFSRKFRDGRVLTMELASCVCDSLQFAAKLNDYVMPEFNFMAFADSTNQVMTLSVSA